MQALRLCRHKRWWSAQGALRRGAAMGVDAVRVVECCDTVVHTNADSEGINALPTPPHSSASTHCQFGRHNSVLYISRCTAVACCWRLCSLVPSTHNQPHLSLHPLAFNWPDVHLPCRSPLSAKPLYNVWAAAEIKKPSVAILHVIVLGLVLSGLTWCAMHSPQCILHGVARGSACVV